MTLVTATRSSPPTLYKRIRTDIERRILSGKWPPGYRIPSEHELMKRYDCSRMTVSKALTELAQADLIQRRKRAGSFVRRPQVLSAVLEITDIRAEITALGRRYDYQLLSRRRREANRGDRIWLGVTEACDVLALEACHSADGIPFAKESRLINLDAVPEAARADFSRDSAGSWLLAHVPWSEAEHRIAAIGADDKIAKTLHTAEGSPCLVINRRTWRNGQTLTAVRLVYPGQEHQLVARFKGRQAA